MATPSSTVKAATISTPQAGSSSRLNEILREMYYPEIKRQLESEVLMIQPPFFDQHLVDLAEEFGWTWEIRDAQRQVVFTRSITDDETEDIIDRKYTVSIPPLGKNDTGYNGWVVSIGYHLEHEAMRMDGVQHEPDFDKVLEEQRQVKMALEYAKTQAKLHQQLLRTQGIQSGSPPPPQYWTGPPPKFYNHQKDMFPGGLTEEAINAMMKQMLKDAG